MKILIFVAVALIPLVAGRDIGRPQASGPAYREISSCSEPYGLQLYPHPKNCDQFYKCENGTLTLETCENGLLFDGEGGVHNYCKYYWNTNCGDRVYELVPTNLSPYCEFSFGQFPVSSGCDIYFYRCAYGESEEVPCEKGQAYDAKNYVCNWPDLLLDVGCNPEKVVGFKCPDVSSLPPNSLTRQFLPYPRYPVPGDCGRFVTCVYDYPRLMNCGYEGVFNEETLACDDPKNVPQCAKYYN